MAFSSEPIAYIPRIRSYYQGLGYGKSYDWATFDQVPFKKPGKSLGQSRVALVTTAARVGPGLGDQGPGAAYNAQAKFYETYAAPIDPAPYLSIAHVAYDRTHTTAEDQNSFFPLAAFRHLAKDGMIGTVSPRYYGLPTNRSRRTTMEKDNPGLLGFLQEDQVDIAILTANCPVCHQSISLAARYLEVNGIATVVLGCAKDIVEHVGVPRLVFSDFPLGNAAGKPHEAVSQRMIAQMALDLLESAEASRTTVQTPLAWSDDSSWKEDYSNINKLSAEEIARRRAEFDRGKEIAKAKRA